MSEGRYERMAGELMHCRSSLDVAIGHLTAYIRLLDKEIPLEAFMMGRMAGVLDLLSMTSSDLDNVREGRP